MARTHSTRWLIGIALMAIGASAAVSAGTCVPPANETCEGAIGFTNADLPYEVMAPLGCVNDVIDKPYFDVFYRFQCTVTGTYAVHMCNSSGDTYLRIYTDGCGWADGKELAVGDDECPGSPPNADPLLFVDLEAGQSYWFELGTWRPDPPWAPPLNSPYNFSVTLDGPQPGLPSGRIDMQDVLSQLQITKDGANLTFNWGDSCIGDDTDFAIFHGSIDEIGTHEPFTCSTGGSNDLTAPAPDGSRYFLVTPHNGIVGGSYGMTSSGAERPKGSPVCLPRFLGACP